MADDVRQETIKTQLELMLQSDELDLANTSIGKLRGALEQALGLPEGSLEPRKTEVFNLIQEVINSAENLKRGAEAEADGAPPTKKEKKAKKDKEKKDKKKDKKEKKEKKEKEEPVIKREPTEGNPLRAAVLHCETAISSDDEAAGLADPALPEPALAGADLVAPAPKLIATEIAPASAVATQPPQPALVEPSNSGELPLTSEELDIVEPESAAPLPLEPASDSTAPAAEPPSRVEPFIKKEPLPEPEDVEFEGALSADAPVVKEKTEDAAVDEGLADAALPEDFLDLPNLSAEVDEGVDPILPDSKSWAVSGGEDGSLRLWNLEDASCIRIIEGHEGSIKALAVDWDDMLALSGSIDGCKLWNLRRGACLRTMQGSHDGCTALAATKFDGGAAVGGCGDGSVQVWDLATGESKSSVAGAHPGGVWAVDVDWKRRHAATGGDISFKVWDMKDWSCLRKVEGHPGGIMCLSVDWSDVDCLRLLVGAGALGADDRNLRLWHMADKKPKAVPLSGSRDVVADMCTRWGDNMALSSGWDSSLKLWSIETCLLNKAWPCRFGRVRSMAASIDKMRVLCGSSAGSLHLLDLQADAAEVIKLEGHIGPVTVVQASL